MRLRNTIVWQGLRYHWRMSLAVGTGVAAATAVIVGDIPAAQ